MITKEEGWKKVKALFGIEDPVTLTDYKTADGKTITCDGELKVGAKLVTKDDAGNASPVADGEYTLEDKRVVKCAAGAVTEIVPAPVADPADPNEPTEMKTAEQMRAAIQAFAADPAIAANPNLQKMSVLVKALFENVFGWQLRQAEEKTAMDNAIATYKSGFENQEKENTSLKELVKNLEAKLAEQEKANTDLKAKVIEGFSLIEQIAETPAAKIEKPKNIFSKDKDKQEKNFLAMADVISELNKKN